MSPGVSSHLPRRILAKTRRVDPSQPYPGSYRGGRSCLRGDRRRQRPSSDDDGRISRHECDTDQRGIRARRCPRQGASFLDSGTVALLVVANSTSCHPPTPSVHGYTCHLESSLATSTQSNLVSRFWRRRLPTPIERDQPQPFRGFERGMLADASCHLRAYIQRCGLRHRGHSRGASVLIGTEEHVRSTIWTALCETSWHGIPPGPTVYLTFHSNQRTRVVDEGNRESLPSCA